MCRVLIVEDDPDTRALYVKVAREVSDEVYSAANADEADACYREHKPDIAVIDIGLPGDRDGLAIIHDDAAPSDTPVIIATCRHDLHHNKQLDHMPTFAILEKPFDLDKLRKLLHQAGDIADKKPQIVSFLRDLIKRNEQVLEAVGGA